MTVYIRADGSIEPSRARISTSDKINYVLTGNVDDEIVVERSNIVIDGADHVVRGRDKDVGIELKKVGNVKLTNLVLKGFRIGIYLNEASDSIITGNAIADDGRIHGDFFYYGILLNSSFNNTISENRIKGDRWEEGVRLCSSSKNSIIGNAIEGNEDGIILEDSSYNRISVNTVVDNAHGIVLKKSSNNIIERNAIHYRAKRHRGKW